MLNKNMTTIDRLGGQTQNQISVEVCASFCCHFPGLSIFINDVIANT